MNTKTTQQGFTIVELLIVIVVIAILAAISIVAYTGVQTRAKVSTAKTNAASIQRVAESYYAVHGQYPSTITHFRSSDVSLPEGVVLLTGSQNLSGGTNTENRLMFRTALTGRQGACVMYWNLEASPAAASAPLLMGNATASNCNAMNGSNLNP